MKITREVARSMWTIAVSTAMVIGYLVSYVGFGNMAMLHTIKDFVWLVVGWLSGTAVLSFYGWDLLVSIYKQEKEDVKKEEEP